MMKVMKSVIYLLDYNNIYNKTLQEKQKNERIDDCFLIRLQ